MPTPLAQCACGLPLHYGHPDVERFVREQIDQAGEYLPVITGTVTYLVQRHYIALHGLKASELPELARLGIVRILPEDELPEDDA